MQVLGAAALMGVLGGTVAYLSTRSANMSYKMRDKGAYSILKSQSTALDQDPGFWVTQLRKQDATLATCLNPSAAGPWTGCPASITTTDTQLLSIKGSGVLGTVALVDMHGIPIAGTVTQPLYFDSNALDKDATACPGGTSNPVCRFQSVGYMVRQNAAGDPGNVTFVIKVEQTAHTRVANATPLAPIYKQIVVNQLWKNPAGNGVPVGAIVAYSGSVATPPTGFLEANGAAISAVTYPQLCAVLGTTWGAACTLPDLRDLFLRGASAANVAGTVPYVQTLQGVSSVPRVLAIGSKLTTSDAGGHEHGLSGTLVSASVTGTATGTVNASGTLAGGWASSAMGGANAGPGSDWHMPATGAYADIAGTVTGVAVPPIPFTLTTPSTGSGTSSASGNAETRPVNIPVYYLIRADY